MKITFIFLIIGLCSILSSCQGSQKSLSTEQDSTITIPPAPIPSASATEELKNWLEAFQNIPHFARLMDSIKVEYPALMSDITFLDSVRGLKIDFVGMVHGSATSAGDSNVHSCYISIDSLLTHGNYALIGTENSHTLGKINWNSFLNEAGSDGDMLANIVTGANVHGSIELVTNVQLPYANNDVVQNRLLTNRLTPPIVGVEPKWVWLTEQVMRSMPYVSSQDYVTLDKMKRFIPLLDRCRSEIAFAEIARQLIKSGRNKKAVVIYGKNHLDDFRTLATKYGTVSKFILTQQCNVPTNE
jgi:hypothetical protein